MHKPDEVFGAIVLNRSEQQAFQELYYPLIRDLPGMRLHELGRLHITLFCIECAAAPIDLAYSQQTVETFVYDNRSCLPPFEVEMGAFGYFSGNGSIHVRIKADDNGQLLRKMVKELREYFHRAEITLWEQYAFSGFITLGRIRRGTDPALVALPLTCPKARVKIHEISLLRKQASTYVPLGSYRLRQLSRQHPANPIVRLY